MAHMREFTTGATRDDEHQKPDYEGYLSPLVIERFGRYMLAHQHTPTGPRASDNWQQGIPKAAYMKSLLRHTLDVWLHHRGQGHLAREPLEEALCAIQFNSAGYLHEHLTGGITT